MGYTSTSPLNIFFCVKSFNFYNFQYKEKTNIFFLKFKVGLVAQNLVPKCVRCACGCGLKSVHTNGLVVGLVVVVSSL